jgi:hypothetical protein
MIRIALTGAVLTSLSSLGLASPTVTVVAVCRVLVIATSSEDRTRCLGNLIRDWRGRPRRRRSHKPIGALLSKGTCDAIRPASARKPGSHARMTGPSTTTSPEIEVIRASRSALSASATEATMSGASCRDATPSHRW